MPFVKVDVGDTTRTILVPEWFTITPVTLEKLAEDISETERRLNDPRWYRRLWYRFLEHMKEKDLPIS